RAVISGSGTLTREAALLGVPAISVFDYPELLSVDLELVKEGQLLHSRDIKQIMDYIRQNRRSEPDYNKFKMTRDQLVEMLAEEIESAMML
ncbi:MAG: DUF354 domain-containing protein, partial [Thermoplasmata archaeon]